MGHKIFETFEMYSKFTTIDSYARFDTILLTLSTHLP